MKDYYIGYDIGTNSVGWAVTDENYNLLRAKGKDLWGVRLFEEAKTANIRRTNRNKRRNYSRRSQRLQLLRELFEEEINKVDKNFYLRLEESKFYREDKKIETKYSLFSDEKFTDVDYFKKYPTIFHLRKDLMQHNSKKDIRLYFLAINQMMKRRGHFLIDGEIENVEEKEPLIANIQLLLNEEFNIDLNDDFYIEILNVLSEDKSKKNEKKLKIKKIVKDHDLDETISSRMQATWELIISGKKKIDNLFKDEEIILKAKDQGIEEINFDSEKYMENESKLRNILDEKFDIIITLKSIADFIILSTILKGKKYLSDAQVERYEKHSKDLVRLKRLIKKYDKTGEKYKEYFRNKNDKTGYVSYIGYYRDKNIKYKVKKNRDYNKFLTDTLKFLNKFVDKNDEDYLIIKKNIELENFLPKQIVSTNSVIPNQIHLIELRKILEALKEDYPSFNEMDEGIEKYKKIEKIFTFKIPYYVGPLNTYHKDKGGNAWMVRNKGYETTPIRPWNFEKVVDLHNSEELFIKRMINECTYIPNEKVVSKSSLIYSEYLVLNELNNLKINGEKIDHNVKMLIFEELFKKDKRVTLKKIRNLLVINNLVDSKNIEFSGLDKDITKSMSSYIDFSNILGENFDRDMVEDIIEMLTIHTGNKKVLKEQIKLKYPEISDEKIKSILSLRYTDWARFSRKFLNGIEGEDKETREINTILGFLRESSDNLMQILSEKYTFMDIITEKRKDSLKNKLDYSVIENLNTSPAVKKMIWQVLKINEELIKVLGKEPKKVFIEMARGKEEKPERKSSRKNKLIELYESIKQESEFLGQIKSKEESDFRSKKLYLYNLQLGRCMYSGEKIDLEDLYGDLYDIDHIIPQKLKKDDSIINNLVLVKKNLNQSVKRDIYPIPSQIRSKENVRELWSNLLAKGLITSEKYKRLVRNEPLTNIELSGFINRQLVETRQSTKIVKDLFEKYLLQTQIITVKAGLTSDLRHDFKILKCRELNDLHHAHDAYLNIIVGDVWNKKFTSNPMNFVKRKGTDYSIKYMYTKNHIIDNKEIWNVERGKKKIIDTLNKPSILMSYESYVKSGELFDANPIGKNDISEKGEYNPLKKDERLHNFEKYGAYASLKGNYFYAIKYKKRNKYIKSIDKYPKNLRKNSLNDLLKYAKEKYGTEEIEILHKKIMYYQEVEINNFRYLLTSKTIGNQLNLTPLSQMFWNVEETNSIKKLYNIYNNNLNFSEENRVEIEKFILLIIDKFNNSIFKNRISSSKIIDKVKSLNLDTYVTKDLFIILDRLVQLSRRQTGGIVNFSIIELADNSGKIQPSSNFNELTIINKSITGIYEKRIKI